MTKGTEPGKNARDGGSAKAAQHRPNQWLLGDWKATPTHHTPVEDAQGILTGTVLATLGITTFVSVLLLSVMTAFQPLVFTFGNIYPVAGAMVAGLLMRFALLALSRHRASLGGAGTLAIYLQEKLGWRAGFTQLAIDLSILAPAFAVVDWISVVYSLIGAVVLNGFLAVNHRTDRYIAK